MALVRNVGALVRNVAGVESHQVAGTFGPESPLYNVPASALPVPDNYPAGLPRPHITKGRLQFANVSPNFDPTPTQIARMMYPLQLWIDKFSPKPYNVFTWNENTDGDGTGIPELVTLFVKWYRNSQYYQNGNFGFWVTPPPPPPKQPKRDPYFEIKYLRAKAGAPPTIAPMFTVEKYDPTTGAFVEQLRSDEIKLYQTTMPGFLHAVKVEDFDFLTMPEPWDDHGWDITSAIVGAVVKAVFALVPYVGPVFLYMMNQWEKDEKMQEAISDAQQSGAIADVGAEIAGQIAAEQTEQKKRTWIALGILGVAGLTAYLYYENDL